MRIYLYLFILTLMTFISTRDGYDENKQAYLQEEIFFSETLNDIVDYQYDNSNDYLTCFNQILDKSNKSIDVNQLYDASEPIAAINKLIGCDISRSTVLESKVAFLCSAVLKPPKIENSQMLRTNKKLLKKTLNKLFSNIKYLKVKNDKIILKPHIFSLRSKVFSINEVLTSLIPSHLDSNYAKKLYKNTVVSSIKNNNLDDAIKDCASIINAYKITNSYVDVCKSNKSKTNFSKRPLKEPDKNIESVATKVEAIVKIGTNNVHAIIKGLDDKLEKKFLSIIRYNPVLTG